jgi:uncharacterized protein (DUF1810 family)
LKSLEKFVIAQEGIYEIALEELKNGEKRSHWMWYIFPQLKGLGRSYTSEYYGLEDVQEAYEYLEHPLLGKRLIECCEALLSLENKRIEDVLPYPDHLKLSSSMKLFSFVQDYPFRDILKKYF